MASPTRSPTTATLHHHALPITDTPADYDALLAAIGAARLVLIGEASHGSHEFYRERARITELGFTAVALEADWPDVTPINRCVVEQNPTTTAREALTDFDRFPSWMWRNNDMLAFVEWLHEHNGPLPHTQRVGWARETEHR